MLIETVTKYIEKFNLQEALKSIKADILIEEIRIREIEERAQKEFNDVEILKVTSLPRLIYKTIGSLNEKLSKEEQELQNIQTKYATAIDTLRILESEVKRVTTEIIKYEGIEESLVQLTKNKVTRNNDGLDEFELKIGLSYLQSQRFNNALYLGKQAKKDLTETISVFTQSRALISTQSEFPTPKTQFDLLNKAINNLTSFNQELTKKHASVAKLKHQFYANITDLKSTPNLLISNERYLDMTDTSALSRAIKLAEDHLELVENQIELLLYQKKETLVAHASLIEEWESYHSPFKKTDKL